MSECYIVTWKIDMDADSPVEAAELAQSMMQSEPYDWQYEVTKCSTGEIIKVDLEHEHLEDEGMNDF
jgi:hypothetical protein